MSTYTCAVCGMGVKTSCATCDAPLVDSSLTTGEGVLVQIAECPNGHGKIKSPLCCGKDMTCQVG